MATDELKVRIKIEGRDMVDALTYGMRSFANALARATNETMMKSFANVTTTLANGGTVVADDVEIEPLGSPPQLSGYWTEDMRPKNAPRSKTTSTTKQVVKPARRKLHFDD